MKSLTDRDSVLLNSHAAPPAKVVVVGLGYIGLPTAAIMAQAGLEVVGIDLNPHAVETVNQGKIHIVEPGLEKLVHGVVSSGKLRASTKLETGDVFIIAVGTPCRDEHKPDLRYVEAAARQVATVLQKGNLVVLESTSPVGTTEMVSKVMAECRPDLTFPHTCGDEADVRVAHCPERVLPGKMIEELVQNDRVIGGISSSCTAAAVALYQTFVRGKCVRTNARTAEMAKLTENSFRDVNIAFANELSLICDRLEIDVWELINVANCHPRVNILKPGPGVGGHCIAVDPWFIVHSAPEQSKLIRTARTVNDGKPHYVIDCVKQACEGRKEPTIACLGLAFKADIDDLRESPSVDIVKHLAVDGVGRVLAVEPHIEQLPAELAEIGVQLTDFNTALEQADVVVLLVDHKAFATVDRATLADKAIIDTRGMWRQATGVPMLCVRAA